MEIKFIGKVVAKQLTLGLNIVENRSQLVTRAVTRAFRPYAPKNQRVMWQVSENILPDNHVLWFVCDVTSKLDLSEILAAYSCGDGRGASPYDPFLMIRLLIYCHLNGIQSTRGIEDATYNDIGCRMITGDQHPDHSTISIFYKKHLAALTKLFDQSVKLCDEAGLVDLKDVATDGTKLKANASLNHAMSYDRMCEKVAKYPEEIREKNEQIKELLREDTTPMRDMRLAELQKDVEIRERRLPVIQEAKAALEKESAEQYAAELKQRQASGKTSRRNRSGKKKQAGKPGAKKQRNFTDSESRVQPSKKGWLQGYNAQVAVCGKTQIIVGQYVTQTTNDRQELLPMARRIHARFGCLPENFTADNGYFSEAAVGSPEWDRFGPTNLLIAPGKEAKGGKQGSPVGRIPKDISIADRMRRKLRTKAGHAAYALRKCIVEPVIGQIKDSVLGFDEFHLRGLQQVSQEFGFVCAIHNLIKLYRHGWSPTITPA